MNPNQPVSAVTMVRAVAALVFSIAVGNTTPVLAADDGTIQPSAAAQTSPLVAGTYRGVSTAVQFDVSPPLRELAPREPAEFVGVENERFDDPPSGLEGPLGPQDIDPLVQREVGVAAREIPAASQSFDGMQ